MPSLPNSWPSSAPGCTPSHCSTPEQSGGATGTAGCTGTNTACLTVVNGLITAITDREIEVPAGDGPFGLVVADAGVPSGRILTAGANVTITDNGPGGTLVISSSGGGSGDGGAYITIYDGVGATINLNSANDGLPYPDGPDPVEFIIEGNPTTFRMSTWVVNSPTPGAGDYGLSFEWSTDGSSWTPVPEFLDLNGKVGELVTVTGALAIPGSPTFVYIRLITINATGFDGTSAIREMVFDFGATGGGGGGSGTVTSVSVATANGFSGTVANPTTTPAITIIAGAITPASVAAVGTVTGSNLSGTNTGDQTITLTGDVTGSGTGSFGATIGNDVVTYAKIQNVSAAARFLGRGSAAGAGDVEEMTFGSGLTLTGTVLSATAGGGGTVTQVSVVTANGVSGSVATDTTTPAITLTLGAIVPTSVNGNTLTTGSGTLTLSTFTLTVAGTASVSGTNTGDQTSVSGNAGTVTVGDAAGDTTTWVLLGTSQTGNMSPSTDAGFTYNATTDAVSATTFIGALTGNASTATSATSATTATVATTITVANEAADAACFGLFVTDATGNLAPKTNTGFQFNSTTGRLSVNQLTCTQTGSILLGTAGSTVGTIAYRNATSGSITVSPATGALGTITQTIPAVNGSVVVATDSTTTTQALFATATAGAPAYRALAAADVPGVAKIQTVTFGVDGGGVAISTGQIKSFATFPQAGTITAWTIAVDTGTATVKFWKVATGTAVPTIANVINTSGVAISSGTYVRSTTTSDFTTTAVAANDIFGCDITAVSGATLITIGLQITLT